MIPVRVRPAVMMVIQTARVVTAMGGYLLWGSPSMYPPSALTSLFFSSVSGTA